jgi:hypothetical protein
MRKSRQLRQIGSIVGVAAAIALAAPALAGAATYGGTFKDGGSVNFKTVNRDGKIVRVKDFAWKNVSAECDQGAFNYTAQLPFSISVSGLEFTVTATGGALAQSITGRFTDHRRKAVGTLNVFGNLGLGKTNCSTGLLRWTATRR